jgi:hypothetical protein
MIYALLIAWFAVGAYVSVRRYIECMTIAGEWDLTKQMPENASQEIRFVLYRTVGAVPDDPDWDDKVRNYWLIGLFTGPLVLAWSYLLARLG